MLMSEFGFPTCDVCFESCCLYAFSTSACSNNGAVLQLAYNETSEGTLGPFNVEAKLTSVGGSVLYATGSGRVSTPGCVCYCHDFDLCHCKGMCLVCDV